MYMCVYIYIYIYMHNVFVLFFFFPGDLFVAHYTFSRRGCTDACNISLSIFVSRCLVVYLYLHLHGISI